MSPAKKTSSKPKLSANFKKKLGARLGQVSVKVGFVHALSIVLTSEQLKAILSGIEQMEAFDEYYVIPDTEETNWGTDIVACVVSTFGEDDDAFEPQISEKMKASMIKQGMEEELIQSVYWRVKCEATPSNALMVWMSDEQYEDLEYDTTYVFIGIQQTQWSTGTKAEGYKNYSTKEEVPEGVTAYETHSLKLIDFIG